MRLLIAAGMAVGFCYGAMKLAGWMFPVELPEDQP